jgi:transcriptional regulator with XRE-family HTH domain
MGWYIERHGITGTKRNISYMMQGSLAERLRILRAREGLTLTEASERIGITRHTLSSLERGGQEPHYPTLAKIAKGYGVPVEELLEEPVPLAEAPQVTGLAEAEAEEEQHVIPQSAANLQRHIEQMKELKELREAQMEELGKGVGLPEALLSQMALADKGLRDLLAELGVLDFAEAVRAGRQMAEPEAIPLCHELLRRLEELEKLRAEAEVASGVAEAYINLAVTKGASGAEAWLEEQTAPEGG